MEIIRTVLILFIIFTLSVADSEKQLIVRLQPDVTVEDMLSANRIEGLKPVRQLSRRMNIWLLEQTESERVSRACITSLSTLSGVEAVQKNHTVQLRNDTKMANDTKFSEQWYLHNTGQSGGTSDADIDAAEAWALSTGGTTVDGQEVVIAIVDDGADLNHEDIDYWKNSAEIPNNGIDDDNNGYVDDYDGWNAFTSSGAVSSGEHGTHVSGIAGAIGNNGKGVTGVNWGAKILPIVGSTNQESIVIEAYSYALELRASYNESNGEKGAFIVVTNSSFGQDYGDPDDFPVWRDLYDSLGKHGILSCAATANLNIDVDEKGDMPTTCPSDYLIAVTNSTHLDQKYTGAGFGATSIDLAAPGTNIMSTIPDNSYDFLTGTSMATPVVAGAVALLVSAAEQPWLSSYKKDPAAGALALKKALMSGVDPLPAFDGITVSGGRINLHNSIKLLRQTSVLHGEKARSLLSTPYIVRGEDDAITLTLKEKMNGAVFSLYSLSGRELDRVAVEQLQVGRVVTLTGTSLAAGYYLLHVTAKQGTYQQKVLFR